MTQLIDPLLQPFALKTTTLRNRVVSTSHEPSYTEDGMPKRRYRLYHEEKAKGGLALTMFGGSTTTAPDSPSAFGQINASTDAVIPWFRELADAVHAHGCAIMCQITHMGRRTCDDVLGRSEVVRVAAVHRTGALQVGDLAVVVAAAAPHRGQAFDACRDLIDTLKAQTPIWKHQRLGDGSTEWVGLP